MAYYDNPGQVNDEAISIVDGKTFQVIQIADSTGTIVDPAQGSVVFDGEVTIDNEVEIKNDSGNPVPISDSGGSLTIDSPALGETDSAVATDDTGTFSLISLFKRALQGITSIIGYVDGVEGLLGTIDTDTGSIDGKLPALSSGRVPVDGSGVTQPVSVSGVVDTITGLEIPAHDYIDMSYTGDNMTGVVYKTGGSGGTTVATLALTYDGNGNITSLTKS